MVWITDSAGTRWVEPQVPKPRKPARAQRFAEIKVGDQLMRTVAVYRQTTEYWIVTDLWFDPVEGQVDPLRGSMVAIAPIRPDGSIGDRKTKTTVRGLAFQQYHRADRDRIAECKARTDAAAAGTVIGIGAGHAIRKRPKVAGL